MNENFENDKLKNVNEEIINRRMWYWVRRGYAYIFTQKWDFYFIKINILYLLVRIKYLSKIKLLLTLLKIYLKLINLLLYNKCVIIFPSIFLTLKNLVMKQTVQ